MATEPSGTLPIASEQHIVATRQTVRLLCQELKLSLVDQTKMITAASELSRNTLIHGGGGWMRWETLEANGRRGLRLHFEDEGPGIAPDAMDKVFERFYTDRPDHGFGQHSGLGLSISKQIAEAHDGRIWVENRLGEPAAPGEEPPVLGARFTVRLPAG